MKTPPLSALRAFEATVRLGSVGAAASELSLTHGAVSHQIKSLEHLLGLALFERQGRRLQPTENGRVYALQVRHGLADLASATERLQRRRRENDLVIGTMPSFGAHWLISRLARFREDRPDLLLDIRATLALADLEADGIDVAIRMGAGGWDGLHSEELFRDRLLPVCAPHFNGGRLPTSPAELLQAPLLTSVENWRPWMAAAGLPAIEPLGLHVNDSNLLIEAVRQGHGIALARESIVFDALHDGRLVAPSDIIVPYPTPCWLVWPTRSEGRRKFDALRHWLRREVEAYLIARGG